MTQRRLLIADDHTVFRRGLRSVLEMEEDLDVVAEAAKGEEAIAFWRELRPDIGLFDLRMPGLSGIQTLMAIRAFDPQAAIILLTTYDYDEDIHAGLLAGAKAYLLKDVEPDELFRCIRAVCRGEAYLQPRVAAKLARHLSEEPLSERELQILRLLARGYSNRDIAHTLSLSESTVKTHLKKLFSKLDVTSRAEAIALGAKRGLVSF
jgi:two-component system NarL family response regulator